MPCLDSKRKPCYNAKRPRSLASRLQIMIYYKNSRIFYPKSPIDNRWRSDEPVKSAKFKKDCRSDGWYLRKLYSLLNSKNGQTPLWPDYVKKDNFESFKSIKDDII